MVEEKRWLAASDVVPSGALDVPSCYVEFAERLPLPQFAGDATITEAKRRDGFEVGNADPIFESTNARK